MKRLFLVLVLGFISLSQAQQIIPSSQLLRQSEQRQSAIDARLMPNWSIKTQSPELVKLVPPIANAVCFPIHTLSLRLLANQSLLGDFRKNIQSALKQEGLNHQTINKTHFTLLNEKRKTPCLTATKIQNISILAQNAFISQGWITSRVLIPEQNLKTGELIFALSTGTLNKVLVNQTNISKTHANRATMANAFSSRSGEPLNLRDLEQGLENLRRLPTVSAEMNITPGEIKSSSDIVVNWQQRDVPIRFNMSIDDSGSDSTGKYLGTLSFAWDNPLHINDILSVSYTHNLSKGTEKTAANGNRDSGKTYNYSFSYNVPFGYWFIDAGMSHYFYDQIAAGVSRNYHYTGDSDQAYLNLSRVLYRNDKHKITVSAGVWKKASKSYINDAEIDVQRRRTGGWKASLSQRSYFHSGTLTSTLGYKRGTRAFGAIEAPEELFDEGTAKSKIWTLDIGWQMPFALTGKQFSLGTQFHAQLNQTKLTPQDKLAIGGRYSVRGFTGEKSLSAERGWYLRNDLGWHYKKAHSAYVGFDIGRVSGKSAKDLPGKMLSGAILGLKGSYSYHGNWNYDVFVSTPIKEPDGFDSDKWVSGFMLNYSL